MLNFQYRKMTKIEEALQAPAKSRFLAGGTTLIDLMKLDVEVPPEVLDMNSLPLKEVRRSESGLHIGALATNAEVAQHPEVRKNYPVLSEAILAGASAQLRNKATTGGNLLQRTRCVYFRDSHQACNKRLPKSGCGAMDGHHRNLAVLGVSDHCIANNPSDQNVALMALEATIHLQGKEGAREVAIGDFYLLPGETPHRENILQEGELVTGVSLGIPPRGAKSAYLKLRDRASYEFALASAAVIVVEGGGRIEKARIAMGGVGAIPWRAREAEKILEGAPATEENFRRAAEAALQGAKTRPGNAFKVELAKRCLVQALKQTVGMKA